MAIMKQLIEKMVGDYLNESYEDDLVESIFEEVSEETWEAIEEAILNELSPELLKKYADKADKDIGKRIGVFKRGDQGRNPSDAQDKNYKKMNTRLKGTAIAKAKMDRYAPADKKAHPSNLSPQARVKSPGSDWTVTAKKSLRDLDANTFQRKYKMTKSEFENKHSKQLSQ